MRVALYARVSTADQSCAMQLTDLNEYARVRNWQIVGKPYVDQGWSGSRRERPEFQRCLSDAEARKFDCVLVWKLDRWGRSLIHMIESIQRLTGAGVRFIAINSGIDTDANNPAARLILHLFGAFAEYERELIRERVSAGVRQHQADFATGKAQSHSGKNLGIGRPRKVFDRHHARRLRESGLSYGAISRELGVSVATLHADLSRRVESVEEAAQIAPAAS